MTENDYRLQEHKIKLEGKEGALREINNKLRIENRRPKVVPTDKEMLEIYDFIIAKLNNEIAELKEEINKIEWSAACEC
jgi:hypothetical protein